jgi:hypothetical protein
VRASSDAHRAPWWIVPAMAVGAVVMALALSALDPGGY